MDAALSPGRGDAERVLGDPGLGPRLLELREAADAARSRPLPALPVGAREEFLRGGDRLGFERPYFERRRALVALGLASWLWREEKYLAPLARAIETVCAEERWALPAHDEEVELFACESAFALAEIRACLEGDLDDRAAELARAEVERRVLSPFLERRGEWAWERMDNNWCAVCAGSIGAASIYLVGNVDRRDAILSRLEPTLDRFIGSFPDDGACLEGLGYWTYGFGFFSAFAELLLRSSGGRRDLLSGDKVRRIAAFPSKAYLTGSVSVAFADSSPGERYRPGLAAYLARRFPEAAMTDPGPAARLRDDECGRWCLSFRDLLWSAEAPSPTRAPAVPAAAPAPSAAPTDGPRSGPPPGGPAWFPEAQWLICPASSPGGLGFAAKGGRNDEPHNHNDVGSFQLALGAEQLVAELGAGEYTRDYFGAGRYSILCNSSLGHSLPIVAGRGQEAGSAYRARDVRCGIAGKGAVLEMDIAAAYGDPSLVGLRRRLDFDGSGLLVLRDEFEVAKDGSSLVERIATGAPASGLGVRAGGATIEIGSARLELTCSPPGLVPRIVVAEHRSHDGSSQEAAFLDFDLPRGTGFVAFELEFRLSSSPSTRR